LTKQSARARAPRVAAACVGAHRGQQDSHSVSQQEMISALIIRRRRARDVPVKRRLLVSLGYRVDPEPSPHRQHGIPLIMIAVDATHRCSPVHSCLKFSAVLELSVGFTAPNARVSSLRPQIPSLVVYDVYDRSGLDPIAPLARNVAPSPRLTHFGTISLNSSILILPAGVSPIETSKKTMGRTCPAGGSGTVAMVRIVDYRSCRRKRVVGDRELPSSKNETLQQQKGLRAICYVMTTFV
jgi:hypothetical protein